MHQTTLTRESFFYLFIVSLLFSLPPALCRTVGEITKINEYVHGIKTPMLFFFFFTRTLPHPVNFCSQYAWERQFVFSVLQSAARTEVRVGVDWTDRLIFNVGSSKSKRSRQNSKMSARLDLPITSGFNEKPKRNDTSFITFEHRSSSIYSTFYLPHVSHQCNHTAEILPADIPHVFKVDGSWWRVIMFPNKRNSFWIWWTTTWKV